MATYIKQSIGLLTIISSILILSACMPRQTDGTYYSSYSYHPYKEAKTIKTKYIEPTYSMHNEMKQTPLTSKTTYTYPKNNPPSNVPKGSITEESRAITSETKIIYVYPDDPIPEKFSVNSI